jgi:hypothetical protein
MTPREIIAALLEHGTYPAWAGEDCRLCKMGRDMKHEPDCPYFLAEEAGYAYLRETED